MKKLIIFLLSFLIIGCSNNNNTTQSKSINLEYTVTSDSISFKTKEFNNNLKYNLYLDDTEINSGDVNFENTINNLESNKEYTLKVYNKNNNIIKKIKTEKLTTLRFGGDVMMTSYFANYIQKNGVDYMWEDVSD